MREKKNYIFLGLGIFLVLIAALAFFIFSSPKFSSKTSAELEALQKVKLAAGNGKLVLNNEDTNALINLYYKSKLNHGFINLKGIYSNIEGSGISLFVPFSVNKINLTLSTEGTFFYENNKYIFNPASIKLGKLPLPKGLLFSMAKKYNSNNVNFTKDEVLLSSSILPLKVNALEVKDNLLLLNLVTSKENSNNTAKNESNIVSEIFKKMLNIDIPSNSNTSSGTNSSGNSGSNTNSSSNNNSINSTPKPSPVSENNKKLTLLNSQLIEAASVLKSSQETKVMNMMESAVQKAISNPSYDFSVDISEIQKYYNTLTKDQKAHIKQSILSNVDIQNAIDVQAMVIK